MLNSILTGPLDQLVKRRDSYLTALRKHGRTEPEIAALMKDWGVSRQIYVAPTDAQALAEAKDAEMWYQDSLRRFQVPERIEDAHPSLQAHFRQLAERLATVNYDDLIRETVAFGSPDTVARKIEAMRAAGVGQVLCWMNFGGLAQEKIRRSMELFAREVMPHFR
jgi:alkanesulfonate monooxygenase SsuD/methylene tetrahydromethanopterin reductase-like flavin-dependent oxidoreductase (luciferase family)